MNKLWLRLSVAFALVALVGVVVAAVLARQRLNTTFRRFVLHNEVLRLDDEGQSRDLVDWLGERYAAEGDWTGVVAVLTPLHHRGMMGRMRPGWGPRPDIVLADADGSIVFDSSGPGTAPGGMMPRGERAEALAIRADGQTVGYLAIRAPGYVALTAAGRAFLQQVSRALLEAGLLAAGLGVLLGLVIARSLAAPLSHVAAAARRISRGQMDQRVPVEGTDEVADLARAFNEMAAGLHQAETLRNNMVADIAHELRTPISVIQGNLRAILDDVYPLDKVEVATIYDETLLLSRLVNDLRELAHAEAGQLSLHLVPTALHSLVEGVVGVFADPLCQKEVRIEVSVPDALPNVRADPDRLRQVLRNLLANALQHTPRGGQIGLSANVATRHSGERAAAWQRPDGGECVRVEVSDTGSGISAEDQPHVFDRFWRAERSRSREHGGSGLGLAIARQLVEAQGGRIGVDSEAGRGTCFWFTLPTC